MAKKRNPQDSTRRNIQAANKKIATLTTRIGLLKVAYRTLERRVAWLEKHGDPFATPVPARYRRRRQ